MKNVLVRLLIFIQRLGALLPWPVQRTIGRALGWVAFMTLRTRRDVAADNIARCLPELTKAERAELLRSHFSALGIGLTEIGLAWFGSDDRLKDRVRAEGKELLDRARAEGRGVLLVTGHWTSLEIGCRLFGFVTDWHVLFRRLGVPAFDEATIRGRLRSAEAAYDKDNVRGVFRALRKGAVVVMVADQADTTDSRVVAPFFGVPATNSGSPARIAAATGCVVLGLGFTRDADNLYTFRFGPRLEHFPSDDPVRDATKVNAAIEMHAREALPQYYWIHRRFKGTGEPTRQ